MGDDKLKALLDRLIMRILRLFPLRARQWRDVGSVELRLASEAVFRRT
jgi:regulator of sirC expression with transglutaminase-like and TPR domain